MRDTLQEFRSWLDKLFREGRINNISETQHWIDVYYSNHDTLKEKKLNKKEAEEK